LQIFQVNYVTINLTNADFRLLICIFAPVHVNCDDMSVNIDNKKTNRNKTIKITAPPRFPLVITRETRYVLDNLEIGSRFTSVLHSTARKLLGNCTGK